MPNNCSTPAAYLTSTPSSWPGAAGHPEGGAGEHGPSQHAEGVGPPHLPQRHRLLDFPEDVHHPAGPHRSGRVHAPPQPAQPWDAADSTGRKRTNQTHVGLFPSRASGIHKSGANSIDIRRHRCIKRSPLPLSISGRMNYHPPPWHSRRAYQSDGCCQCEWCFDRMLYSAPRLRSYQRRFNLKRPCLRACAHKRVRMHPSGAQHPQTAFLKSLLKMIVSVGHPSPLILICLCWQAFLRAAKRWY